MLLTQASSQYQKKQLWFTCRLESQRQIQDGTSALVLRTAILLAVNAVLLSLGFQYIHVSGKLRFSSKTQTATAISCSRRFCYSHHKLPYYMNPLDNWCWQNTFLPTEQTVSARRCCCVKAPAARVFASKAPKLRRSLLMWTWSLVLKCEF